MASRTQLRLAQLTGSAKELKVAGERDYTAATTVALLTGSDLGDLLGAFGGAFSRITGKAGEPFNQSEGRFDTTNFDVNTAIFTVDATGIVSIDATGASNLTTHGDLTLSGSDNITLTAREGTTTIANTQGAIDIDAGTTVDIDGATGINIGKNADVAIDIDSSTLDIDASGAITIDSDSTIGIGTAADDQAINIGTDGARTITIGDESAGNTTAINIKALGAAGSDVSIESAAGSVNITAGEDIASSVVITGTGVQILSTDTSNGLKLATGTSGVPVTIGNGTSEVTVQDNLTVSGDATVAGSLTVQGTVTSVDTTNSTIKDALIVLNSGSVANPTNADAGIIFAQPDVSRALFVDQSDSRIFKFANTYTSGSATAVVPVGLADVALKKILFHDNGGESITGDGNDITLASGGDLKLNVTTNVEIPVDKVLTFDGSDANDKISSDGTDLTIACAGDIILDANLDIELNANGADIIFKDNTAEVGRLQSDTAKFILSSSVGRDLVFDSNSGTFPLDKAGVNFGNIMLDPGLILSSSTGNDITIDSNSGKVFLSKESGGAGSIPKNVALYVSGSTGLESLRVAPSAKSYSEASTIAGNYFVDFSFGNVYNNNVLSVSGSVKILSNNRGGGVNLKAPTIPSVDVNLTLPGALPSNNDEFLVGDNTGALEFKTAAELGIQGAPVKAIKILNAAVAAGSDLQFNAVNSGTAITGDDNLELSDAQGESLDVFVNGQLVLSGTAAARAANPPTVDYNIKSVDTLVFAFDLEVDDVIQLIKR